LFSEKEQLMLKHFKPTPIDNEIFIVPNKVIMSKTNYKGIIQYVNDYFIEVCGYNQDELIGKPHNIIRHPEMPKVVFKIMWEKLHRGENLYAVVKNLTKDGSFYWVVTKFETTFDDDGNVISHYARRKAVPLKIKQTAETIYKTIRAIEEHDVDLAEKTFHETLEKYGLTYDEFFLEVAEMNETEIHNYFQSSELNTNTTHEDTILEIETELEQKNKQMLESLKQIEQLKNNSNNQNNSEKKPVIKKDGKGFLGNISELNELKLALKKNNSL
jgi:PAS domain S-box-containing protein